MLVEFSNDTHRANFANSAPDLSLEEIALFFHNNQFLQTPGKLTNKIVVQRAQCTNLGNAHTGRVQANLIQTQVLKCLHGVGI